MKIEALLKSGETGAILRSVEDAKERLADVRASVAAEKSSKNGTSPQKEPQPDNEQKEHDGHNADDSQDPRNGARRIEHTFAKRKSQKQQYLSDFKNIKCKTSYAFRTESSERARRTAKAPGETGTRSKTTGTRSKRKGDSRLARRGGPQGQNC